MTALLRRVRRSPFARDLRQFGPVLGVAAGFLVTLLVGVELGMALDDLTVIIDPVTGLATVIEVTP